MVVGWYWLWVVGLVVGCCWLLFGFLFMLRVWCVFPSLDVFYRLCLLFGSCLFGWLLFVVFCCTVYVVGVAVGYMVVGLVVVIVSCLLLLVVCSWLLVIACRFVWLVGACCWSVSVGCVFVVGC